jgi:hypothetical protein
MDTLRDGLSIDSANLIFMSIPAISIHMNGLSVRLIHGNERRRNEAVYFVHSGRAGGYAEWKRSNA